MHTTLHFSQRERLSSDEERIAGTFQHLDTMLPQQSDLPCLPDGTVSASDMAARFSRAGAVPCAGTRGENCPAEFQKGIAISVWQNTGGALQL